jgi:hypothetical protein
VAIKDKRVIHRWRLRAHKDNPETTAIYTPRDYDAVADEAGKGPGILRLATGELKMPSSMEDMGGSSQAGTFPKVVMVIVVLSILFISIIAYFVAQMPVKQ